MRVYVLITTISHVEKGEVVRAIQALELPPGIRLIQVDPVTGQYPVTSLYDVIAQFEGNQIQLGDFVIGSLPRVTGVGRGVPFYVDD